jgi:outer membrane lipoprotein SlyB
MFVTTICKGKTMRFTSLRQAAIIAAFVTAGSAPALSQAAPQCQNCGTVVSTHTYEREAQRASGVGGVGGAVVGGLLGNQVGSGNGRTLATVAGAVGGAYAGNKLERNIKTDTYTDIRVRMARGGTRTFTERGRARLRNGDHVRVQQGHLVRN